MDLIFIDFCDWSLETGGVPFFFILSFTILRLSYMLLHIHK